ncbi:MAG: OmpH family outer membrane protein [Hyphomicrobiales bacterium]
MKKTFLSIIILFTLSIGTSVAQKYAYVDSDYILQNIPEYTDAQEELDQIAKEYQEEISKHLAEVDKLYKAYQAEQVLLPEDMKAKKENEIVEKEKQARELQKKYFGPQGELFNKRKELIEPIQEKVYNAIQTISQEENYDFVFDKSGSLTILYSNPKLDVSDDVLDEIGKVMQTIRKEDRK